jgi:hypothetical protein
MFWTFKLSFDEDIQAFLTWRLFGLFFEKFGEFLFKSSGHPGHFVENISKFNFKFLMEKSVVGLLLNFL